MKAINKTPFVSIGFVIASWLQAAAGLAAQTQNRGVQVPEASLAAGSGAFRALVIGIDGYRNWIPLRFAERDAKEIRDILVTDYAFEPDNVVTLLGREATESNVMAELRRLLFEVAGEEDRLLIYYAGHGQIDPMTDTGFWIPVDGDLYDTSTWIPFTWVQDQLKAERVVPKNVIVITDSCYGGALTRSGPPPPNGPAPGNPAYERHLQSLMAKRSRQVIASGGFEVVPDKSKFAEFLKAALRANPYPAIDLELLFYSQVYPGLLQTGQQSPTMNRLVNRPGEDGQFVLFRGQPKTTSFR